MNVYRGGEKREMLGLISTIKKLSLFYSGVLEGVGRY